MKIKLRFGILLTDIGNGLKWMMMFTVMNEGNICNTL